MQWETVIGLEVHAQLNTASKIFSGAATAYGAAPNRQACALDLGMPGVLPVLNAAAVEKAILFGLAIQAEIGQCSVFARKNYFYPDLPKGYQISQYAQPIVGRGSVQVDLEDGTSRRISITRAHLEEDAGKSLHENFSGMSGIDLNRAGTPLLEIVSEPELRSAREAVVYLKTLHTLVRYLDICDGNLQEGSFRCDANVSVRPVGTTELGTRTEIKNLNSFRFLERAIQYEVQRQIECLESGHAVVQETRLYDPDREETRSMRSKEEAHDYRYFPDPDLLPLEVSTAEIEALRLRLPELPGPRRARFLSDFGLSPYDAGVLTATREMAEYFEAVVVAGAPAKLAANWVIGELTAALHRTERDLATCPVAPTELALLLCRIQDATLSGTLAKEVFEGMWQGEGSADAIIAARGLRQITDGSTLDPLIDAVLAEYPEQWTQLCAGKDKLMGFFVGQIMKRTAGKASPGQVNERLRTRLPGSD